MLLACVACSDEMEQDNQFVHFCVRAAWQDGRAENNMTRASINTNILAGGTSDIVIDKGDYPESIEIACSDNTKFHLTTTTFPDCSEHKDYISYGCDLDRDKRYTIDAIQTKNLTFTATCTLVDGDLLEGTASYETIRDNHIQLALHHTQALIRFAFKVDTDYDKIRTIELTGIKLNGVEALLKEKAILTTQHSPLGYVYVAPTTSVSTKNTIECTYNIYDKDQVSADHITRKGVTATNVFSFGNLKMGTDVVRQLQAGYYYDLNITINPDYLYVLAEHDNKHLMVE